MKKFKSTFLLFGVFLVLLAVVLFYANDNSERRRIDSDLSKPLLSTEQLATVTEVSFTKAGQSSVVVTKDATLPDTWHIGDALVDPDEAKLLNTSLAELPTGRRSSKNKESWEGYGLADGKADLMVLKAGDTPLKTLFLGSPGPSYPSFYMRQDASDEVYLVNSNIQQLVAYDANRWKDKRLFVFDKDKIQKVSVRIAQEHWAFSLQNAVWSSVTDKGSSPIVKPEDFQKYLDDLISLKGVSIETDTKLFQNADNAIDITMQDGKDYIVSVSKKDDKDSYAQVTGRTDLLHLSSDLSARLRPSFLDKPVTPAPAAADNKTLTPVAK